MQLHDLRACYTLQCSRSEIVARGRHENKTEVTELISPNQNIIYTDTFFW